MLVVICYGSNEKLNSECVFYNGVIRPAPSLSTLTQRHSVYIDLILTANANLSALSTIGTGVISIMG